MFIADLFDVIKRNASRMKTNDLVKTKKQLEAALQVVDRIIARREERKQHVSY